MTGVLRRLLIGVALIGAGWLVGSIYPAPDAWTAPIKGRADPLIAQLDLTPEGLERLRSSLTPEQFAQLRQNATLLAASTGDVIRVERGGEILDEHIDAVEARRMAPPPVGSAAFETSLSLCPGMTVSNAPPSDAQNRVSNFASMVSVNSVSLAANPTRGACLASGFGARNGRTHKGIDLHSRDGGPIFAAGDGNVIERLYRDDYGNMLLIDHGNGVYTRYAHLSSFAADIAVGARVTAGQQIGLMGNTAAYQIPVHLHYELLTGDYDNPRRSFGLTPVSPFNYPATPVATVVASAAATPPAAPPTTHAGAAAPAAVAPPRSVGALASLGAARCPVETVGAAAVVTVNRGETLSQIARACYGRASAWPQVASCNDFLNRRNRGGVSPLNGGDLLYIGDRLVLPAPDGACPA
jgi:murein DD-endopeptidase MepM/ murein hydrolase activator NlpD